MFMLQPESVKTKIKEWKKSVNKRKTQLLRFVEYKRLKRIRNHKSPQYSHCKNCGEKLLGMYCHKCGQYALDINQSFLMYIKQFFENAYQFDGKAFQTLRYLFVRPGFLSKEFIAGKINSYVHPLKLYMCVSLVFFSFILVLYSSDNYTNELVGIVSDINSKVDSTEKQHLYAESDSLKIAVSDTLEQASDTTKNSSWKKKVKILYQNTFAQTSQKLPFLLLALLPIFAFLLRSIFRKTHRAYMSSFVFSVHIHTVLLIVLALAIFLHILTGVTSIYLYMLALFGIYLLLAIRGFYQNNWVKTILKTGIVSLLYLIISTIAISILLIVTLAKVHELYWS